MRCSSGVVVIVVCWWDGACFYLSSILYPPGATNFSIISLTRNLSISIPACCCGSCIRNFRPTINFENCHLLPSKTVPATSSFEPIFVWGSTWNHQFCYPQPSILQPAFFKIDSLKFLFCNKYIKNYISSKEKEWDLACLV
jgi:hypothetical protein